jgi:mono/diheme cytochrome c family protein
MAGWLRAGAALVIAGAAVGWFLTAPATLDPAQFEGLTADAERGAVVFAAAGCASCHLAPEAVASGPPVLAGGRAFQSDFGTFHAPNISSDPVHGIGGWSDADLLSAIMVGVGPGGEHLYPAFPYAAYQRARPQDMVDLVAYLRTLPADATPNVPHDLGFPFNIRRAVGLWKLMFGSPDWVLADTPTPALEQGRYLVEALAHCGECHTPRNALGGLRRDAWLSGAPNPSGEGTIPNITPGALTWSEAQIAEYLRSGFTPEFDTAGGEMAEVIRNTGQLSDENRLAIAAYLKAVPAIAPPPAE